MADVDRERLPTVGIGDGGVSPLAVEERRLRSVPKKRRAAWNRGSKEQDPPPRRREERQEQGQQRK